MVSKPPVFIDIEPVGADPVKALYTLPLLLGVSAALFGLVFAPQHKVIWNRSASAPGGLFWLSDEPITKGQWVLLSARSMPAQWAASRGYVGAGWPLLKQVAGLPGDRICRHGVAVFVNDRQVAAARLVDTDGRGLPAWEGCRTLRAGDVFLLSPHPSSLDGRYFGAVKRTEIEGVARPIFIWAAHGLMAE